MRIGYFIRNIGISGGVKVFLQHVQMLKDLRCEVVLITRRIVDDWINVPHDTVVLKRDDLADIPECGLYVATFASDVRRLFRTAKARTAHLCQGYEPDEYWARIKGESVPEKYATGKHVLGRLKKYRNSLHFKRKIREFDATYRLPTIKIAVSRNLALLIEKRYQQKCFLVQNGIDHNVFYPNRMRAWGGADRQAPVKVLSIGSMSVGAKGIPDTLEAIRIMKQRRAINFTRVSPGPPSQKEMASGIIDRFLTGLSEEEMALLYRDTDIFISASLEAEGFGLPAIEALASGVPSILTEISAHESFSVSRDFAWFVPTHAPDKIAIGIETFVENPALRERCIEKGIEVAGTFTLDRMKEDLARFINEVCAV